MRSHLICITPLLVGFSARLARETLDFGPIWQGPCFTQACGSKRYLNNLPAKRPGPREAGKQSGRSFATATLCFYKPRQGVLFDPVTKDLKGPTLIQTLCYTLG